jgi:hypothetical protein
MIRKGTRRIALRDVLPSIDGNQGSNMKNRTAVIVSLCVGLTATGLAMAQNTGNAPSVSEHSQTAPQLSVHQPLNLQFVPASSEEGGRSWSDQRATGNSSNAFAGMFDAQAQNGDWRRVPMYLLVPFAKVTPSNGNAMFGAHPTNPATQPDVVKDVGALVRTIRSGG